MDIDKILKLDPTTECKIYYTMLWGYSRARFQLKQESNHELDTNKLPLIEDEDLEEDYGRFIYNEKNEPVYDPDQKIYESKSLDIKESSNYKSKSFVKLFQDFVKDVPSPEELTWDMFIMECCPAFGDNSIIDLFDLIKCDDYELIEINNVLILDDNYKLDGINYEPGSGISYYENFLWLYWDSTEVEYTYHTITIEPI